MLPLRKEGFISYCKGPFPPPSLLPSLPPPLPPFFPSFLAESLLFDFLSLSPWRKQGFVQVSSSMIASFVTLDII